MNSEHFNTENRKHKDSLFVDYFSKDRDWKQHFLMMIEHQSTINPNMPLRLLEYVTRIYGNKVASKAKFSNQLIPLAKPEFIVFYTGKENIPPESYLSLSDAFKVNHFANAELTLELKVKVCKIKGKEPSQIVSQCSDLEQYVQFLKLIDEAKSDGQAQPLTRAIREAVRCNVLKDYLERKGGEVLSILMTEYDYATDIAVKQEEAFAIGRNEGILLGLERGLEQGAYKKALETAKSLLEERLPPEIISRCTNLPLETVCELAREL